MNAFSPQSSTKGTNISASSGLMQEKSAVELAGWLKLNETEIKPVQAASEALKQLDLGPWFANSRAIDQKDSWERQVVDMLS